MILATFCRTGGGWVATELAGYKQNESEGETLNMKGMILYGGRFLGFWAFATDLLCTPG